MKKILLGLLTAGAVGGVAIFATGAFFSDTEKSTGNTFQAGAIDLKVDYHSFHTGVNGQVELGPTWTLKDLTQGDKFFDLTDVKPGDHGEGTISLHVTDNDAWACATITPTLNDDVSSNEPELEAGDVANTDSIYDGELAQNMTFKIWADVCGGPGEIQNDVQATPGDNIYQDGCDRLLTSGTGPITPTTWALANPAGNVFTGTTGPLLGTQDYFLGVEWSVPTTVGNMIQTDKYMADISFYVEQSRNNLQFVCPSVTPQGEVKSLRLENETEVVGGPWTVLSGDQIYADLTWADGSTFAYNLTGKGLANNTSYSLIYYADGWPGNNPGAFIDSATTNGSGNIVMSGSPELGMDMPKLPDGNFAIGAKIWLVLSSDYNNGLFVTGPMTAWQPEKYLFEGNVYIKYNDTDI